MMNASVYDVFRLASLPAHDLGVAIHGTGVRYFDDDPDDGGTLSAETQFLRLILRAINAGEFVDSVHEHVCELEWLCTTTLDITENGGDVFKLDDEYCLLWDVIRRYAKEILLYSETTPSTEKSFQELLEDFSLPFGEDN